MIYEVNIQYRKFIFANGTTALNFAELALKHLDDASDGDCTITLRKENEDGHIEQEC